MNHHVQHVQWKFKFKSKSLIVNKFFLNVSFILLQGFVVVDNFFKAEELEPCKRDIENLVEQVAQKLYRAGKIESKSNKTVSILLCQVQVDGHAYTCIILHPSVIYDAP